MPEPFKNTMFTPTFFDALAAAVQGANPAFDSPAFLARVYDASWDGRELMARMRHTAVALRPGLPNDFRAALDVLRQASAAVAAFSFETLSLCEFVALYGLDDWEAALPALETFTQLGSAEFAVRPFILRDPDRMMRQMLAWAGHDSHHVRRLASEGCRPRLPWGVALPVFKADPAPILPVLERLKLDESEYVRRSVANNLNDIAKDNPQVVLETARRWRAHDSPEMRALLQRALRTLVKAADAEALALLGYGGGADFAVRQLTVEPAVVPAGGTVTIRFEIESRSAEPLNLMIDYVLHLAGANGKARRKVFKLAKRELLPGETIAFVKQHSFRAVTTRRYYPGEHAVEIQVNGARSERAMFHLAGESAG